LSPAFSTSRKSSPRTYKITFSRSGIIGGSLADGRYRLTVHADLVKDSFGRPLTADFSEDSGGFMAILMAAPS